VGAAPVTALPSRARLAARSGAVRLWGLAWAAARLAAWSAASPAAIQPASFVRSWGKPPGGGRLLGRILHREVAGSLDQPHNGSLVIVAIDTVRSGVTDAEPSRHLLVLDRVIYPGSL
jgi:hypothetical protein